ncbi:MAG: acyl-ACP--UDP-N-acetylglucosamine O-acyltransferase [Pseudomonadota bacterium]
MIHPTAIIDPSARLAPDVKVGPYSIIGADVEIGAGSVIGPHVVIQGPTRIGRENRIFQFASVGDIPQDKKYAGEPTTLIIGDRNTIRECCTINRGTVQDRGTTQIGSDNWIMAYVHIAHDCIIGDKIILANNASLAGHVRVDDYAILGGFTLVHQFCQIGAHCFTAMNSVISKDVPPYLMVSGHMAQPHGLNTEGLKRRGFSPEALNALKRAYKLLYRENLTIDQAKAAINELAQSHAEVAVMSEFLERITRGIVR